MLSSVVSLPTYDAVAYGLNAASADNTTSFNNLLSLVHGNGGGIIDIRPNKTPYLFLGQIVFPNSGGAQLQAYPFHIRGGGRTAPGQENINAFGGTILDLRFNRYRTFTDGGTTNGQPTLTSTSQAAFTSADVGLVVVGAGIPAGTTILSVQSGTSCTMSAGATATASGVSVTVIAPKILALGCGAIEWAGITFSTGLAGDQSPFWLSTNPVVHIHDCTFQGDTTVQGQSCLVDAIYLGGTTTTTQTNRADAPFQGYGSRINNCYFHHIRVAVQLGTYCNNVIVDSCNIGDLCGSASGGCFILNGGPGSCLGNVIAHNTIECVYYPYPIQLSNTARNNRFLANGYWDATGTTVAFHQIKGAGSIYNVIDPAYASTGTPVVEDNVGMPTSATQIFCSGSSAPGNQLGVTTTAWAGIQIWAANNINGLSFGPIGGPNDSTLVRNGVGIMQWTVATYFNFFTPYIRIGSAAVIAQVGNLGTTDIWFDASGSTNTNVNVRFRAKGTGEILCLSYVNAGNGFTPGVQTLTYGTTVAIDASVGACCKLNVTDTVAFTISGPTNGQRGQQLQLKITNSSGGTMGAITWPWLHFGANSWSAPANGLSMKVPIELDVDGVWVVNSAPIGPY